MMAAMKSMRNNKKLVSALLLLTASMIWGFAFVAQQAGMAHIGPLTFSAIRAFLAGLALIPCFLLFDKLGLSPKPYDRKTTWKAGLLLGVIIAGGGNLQQIGLVYTSVAKAGFITSLYIVLVPIFGLLIHKRAHPMIWVCAVLAAVGLYFLSIRDGFSVNKGDLYTMGCAVLFAVHILVIDHYAGKADVVRMSCIQFFVYSALSAVGMAFTETPSWPAIAAAWLPLVYAGVLSGAACYTVQMLAQRNIEPAAASLLLSPESVFAALGGWVLLGQVLSGRELFGCTLVLIAVVLSQIPWRAPAWTHKKQRAL